MSVRAAKRVMKRQNLSSPARTVKSYKNRRVLQEPSSSVCDNRRVLQEPSSSASLVTTENSVVGCVVT